MFWLFAADQFREKNVANYEGESLSLTKILHVLCQLTAFVERTDVLYSLQVFSRDNDYVPVYQSVKTFFWIIKHGTVVEIDTRIQCTPLL